MGNPDKLIWDAEDYSKSNNAQHRDAVQLMEQIEKDGTKDVDIIVDIGCGPGNVTAQLSKRIPHKKIYASDFDPQMVSYADKNHNDGTIEYFVQDIGLPWEQLDEKLKALEGKVDIVWSNRVLHWVKDKATAAKTIARLLKSGGRCYVNITFSRDPFEFSEENKNKYENYYKIESHEKQQALYKSAFEDSGLSQVNIEMIEKDWTFESEEQYALMCQASEAYWSMTFSPPPEWPQEEVEKAIKTMDEFGKAFWCVPYGKNPNNNGPENKLRMYYEQGRIFGTK